LDRSVSWQRLPVKPPPGRNTEGIKMLTHTLPLLEALQGFAAPPAPVPPVPHKLTGHFLSRNRLPVGARTAIALRLSRGGESVSDLTLAQACRLARAPYTRVRRELGHHRNVGDALVRAFSRATDAERLSFVRACGVETLWSLLTQAL
jgi:hypothetical protein